MAIKLQKEIYDFPINTIIRDLSYDIEKRLVDAGFASFQTRYGVNQTKPFFDSNVSNQETILASLDRMLFENKNGNIDLKLGKQFTIDGVPVATSNGSIQYFQFSYHNNSSALEDNQWLPLYGSAQPSGVNGGLINGDFLALKVPCNGTLSKMCIYGGKGRPQNNALSGDELGLGLQITAATYDNFTVKESLDLTMTISENINGGQFGKVDFQTHSELNATLNQNDLLGLKLSSAVSTSANKLTGFNHLYGFLGFLPE